MALPLADKKMRCVFLPVWFSLKIEETGIITSSSHLYRRHSHTYYTDIRSANIELITQLQVYNNVTKGM